MVNNGYAQIVRMEFCTYGLNGSDKSIHPIGFKFFYDTPTCALNTDMPQEYVCGTYPPPQEVLDHP